MIIKKKNLTKYKLDKNKCHIKKIISLIKDTLMYLVKTNFFLHCFE